MKNSRVTVLGGLALVLSALLVYHNSLGTPFIFDDGPSILGNQTIRQLWPPWAALSPPADGGGVTGRPLTNLSLAVNYALGGFEVQGYHVMNLVLHVLVALTLWGVLRRTLERKPAGLPAALHENADLVPFVCALLWTVHPLLTESVVCIVQRNELLGGLFYLLTLYGFIRATDGESATAGRDRLIPPGTSERRDQRSRPTGWLILSVAACLGGMASKEIVATAPLMVLLYDRAFVGGTFRAAWQQRKGYYGALAATWVLLGWLMWHSQQRSGTVGFGLGVSSWTYLLTQCEALVMYLKLSFWPHPLVLDYGTPLVASAGEVWWQGLVILALLAGTVLALVRRPMIGFLGAWFFVILAPSSSFVPLTTQTMAEHRMYLPLIAVIVLAVVTVTALLGRRALTGFLVLAVVAGGLTARRNRDYHDDLALWQDTVAKRPDNSRALAGLGTALYNRGNLAEALRYYEDSLRLDPYSGHKHYNVGLVLDDLGRPDEAIRYYREALVHVPLHAAAHTHLAAILVQRGQSAEALQHLAVAMNELPGVAGIRFTQGLALTELNRLPEAIAAYDEAIRLDPGNAGARLNLGILHAREGRLPAALEQLREAVRLKPDVAPAHANLGIMLVESGDLAGAVVSYREALRLQPGYAKAHYNLGNALIGLQRLNEARAEFEAALRADPNFTEARKMLARLQSAGVR